MATDGRQEVDRWTGVYADALARARRTAADAAISLDVPRLLQVAEDTDRSTIPVICDVLRRLRAFHAATADLTLDDIMGSMPIIPKYAKLGRRWILDLAEEGVLLRTAQGFRAHNLYFVQPATAAENPYFHGISTLLVNVLTGKYHVLEYVFGSRRPDWFTSYTATAYDADPIFAYQHRIVAKFVGTFAAHASAASPLRILEVGAGMGGLTARLLPLLPKGMSSYLYSDVAREFLELGKQRFRNTEAAVAYGVYDINKAPVDNKIEPGQFDIIAAFDVLHCARDLGQTLGWLNSLLCPGGVLINEQLTRNRLSHLIFPGIMPGFTDFEDDRLSDCRTLLTPAAWPSKLSASGFADCHILPADARMLDQLGHGVIIAKAS